MPRNLNFRLIPEVSVVLLLATTFVSGHGLQTNYNSTEPVNNIRVGYNMVRRSPPMVPRRPPTKGTKFVLDLDSDNYKNGKCLDGTPGAYYLSKPETKSNKWYIFRQGGGFCTSILDCLRRSRTNLGSSISLYGWDDELEMTADDADPHMGFSRDPIDNPLMYDWNFVFVIYCDGGYHASSNMTPTMTGPFGLTEIHFKGAWITKGIIEHLGEKQGFADATEVVVGGCSAGGISTLTTGTWIEEQIQKTVKEKPIVAFFSCSGFFLDYDYPPTKYTSTKHFNFYDMNISGQVSKECLETYKDDNEQHKCLVGQIGALYNPTPTFLWESLYDSYMLANVLDGTCDSAECAVPHANNIRSALYNLWHIHENHGGYLTGCSHHCEGSDIGAITNLVPIDGVMPMKAFALWYESFVTKTGSGDQRYWQENKTYPCESCCPSNRLSIHHHPLDDYYE